MSAPVRFPAGVTTDRAHELLGFFGQIPPFIWHQWADDFDGYTAADWTVTVVDGGAAGADTQAVEDEDGGVLKLTNNAADNDNSFLQWASETFKFESGKKLVFQARFKVSDATQSDFVMGLQITDATPLDVTDGVFFQKDDDDTELDVHVEKDNTQTSETNIHTMANDTYVEVGFYYDGKDAVNVFVDGSQVARLGTDNLPDDEELTISFGIQNGEAAAKSMSIDYILSAKER